MQVTKEIVPYNVVVDHSNSASKKSLQTLGGRYRIPMLAKPRVITRKSMGGDIGSSRKRPRTETPTTSSGSELTKISTASRGSEQVIVTIRQPRRKRPSYSTARSATRLELTRHSQ
jgi:hypothetical protein